MNEIDEVAGNCSLVAEKFQKMCRKIYNKYLKWCAIRKNFIKNCYCKKSILAYFIKNCYGKKIFWLILRIYQKEKTFFVLVDISSYNLNVDISRYSSLFRFKKKA